MLSSADDSSTSSPLRLGDAAPDFHARTTLGDVRLSDYRGRWVVLFSHPGDFTPVCTSEFLALSHASSRFGALNCELLAISVDSLHAHFGWVRAIREHFGVTIPFPIVEDPSMVIGRAYGMLADDAQDAATLRATFFIDPEGIIRARLCYPASIGRSVEEMLRVLTALQRVDRDGILTPEGWQPGDDVLLPPFQGQRDMLGVPKDGCWFHRTQPDRPDRTGK